MPNRPSTIVISIIVAIAIISSLNRTGAHACAYIPTNYIDYGDDAGTVEARIVDGDVQLNIYDSSRQAWVETTIPGPEPSIGWFDILVVTGPVVTWILQEYASSSFRNRDIHYAVYDKEMGAWQHSYTEAPGSCDSYGCDNTFTGLRVVDGIVIWQLRHHYNLTYKDRDVYYAVYDVARNKWEQSSATALTWFDSSFDNIHITDGIIAWQYYSNIDGDGESPVPTDAYYAVYDLEYGAWHQSLTECDCLGSEFTNLVTTDGVVAWQLENSDVFSAIYYKNAWRVYTSDASTKQYNPPTIINATVYWTDNYGQNYVIGYKPDGWYNGQTIWPGIHGVITLDGGQPLSDVEVTAYSGQCWQSPHYFTRTNSSGEYCIRCIPPGSYYVVGNCCGLTDSFVVPEWWDAASGTTICNNAVNVQTNSGQVLENIDFSLEVGGRISGEILSTEGQPIAGIEVTAFTDQCWRIPEPTVTATATTDSNGGYTIRDVPVGTYFLNANCYADDNFWVAEWWDGGSGSTNCGDAAIVDVVANEVNQNKDFGLALGGRIVGRVTSTSLLPLANINVTASPDACLLAGSEIFSAWTAQDGSFMLNGLPTGNYYLVSNFGDPKNSSWSWEWWNNYNGTPLCDQADSIAVLAEQIINDVDFSLSPPGRPYLMILMD